MKNKLFALLLALLMLLSITACSAKKDDTDTAGTPDGAEDTTADTVNPGDTETEPGSESGETPEPTPEETPDALPGGTTPDSAPEDNSSAPADEPAETPDERPGSTTPDSAPGDSSSAGTSDGSVDLTAFYDTLFQGADSPAMDRMPDDALDVFYPGLAGIETNQLVVAMPMISAVAAEIALIEVADSADIPAVKDILQARIDAQVAGGAWYPATIAVWENSSAIVVNGNCIMLIVLDSYQDVVDSFNALFA